MNKTMPKLLGRILLFSLLVILVRPVSAADFLQGDFSQGGLLQGLVTPGSRVLLDQRTVPVSETGYFLLGFGRDAQPEQRLTIIAPDGTSRQETLHIAQRAYRIERIDGISPRMMNPTEEDLIRIGREAELVAEARGHSAYLRESQEEFSWPLHGRISGIYGSQRIINGEPRRPHFGVDIAAPAGTPVRAPAGGVVSLAHQGMFYSGKTLIIDHGSGLSSSFLHLQEILVSPGETVSKGQQIATVGATGRVTGPHLDWRINWYEVRLDPALLVPPMPDAQ